MNFFAKPVLLSGMELHPIIEGGKGIGISNGITAGSFAAASCVGTFSGVNATMYDDNGNVIPIEYHSKTRKERHEELVDMGIKGAISQAKRANDVAASNKGRIHMNILWEMGGAERVLRGALEGAKGLIHGITCGAGMPYKLGPIAEEFNVFYYPIVSSMRAFRALWKRSYEKYSKMLGGIVYEDPWLAGGHNGLSNSENPEIPEDPKPRVRELRNFMNEVGLKNVPIIMAGGVWHLKDWADWIDDRAIAPVAFQFGTRPILTKESPVSDEWKNKLLTLKEGDVFLNRFSPTGFYSSAVNNNFIKELRGRSERQVDYTTEPTELLSEPLPIGARGRVVYIDPAKKSQVKKWYEQGYTEAMRTPDSTLIFVTPEKEQSILTDQINCMGCLSACKFSNWSEHGENHNTGKKADPRSFCIQKTLQDIIGGAPIDDQLMFSGHNAFKFQQDPFYKDGFIPTIRQLVDRILTGY